MLRLKPAAVSLSKWSGAMIAGLLLSSPLPARAAEVSGSVEDGLRVLAGQIVQKTSAADRTKIAVLPFQNADGTCSVLSTYIVDELTLALFSVPDSKLTLIERSQLEALIAELTIGESGLLNPATTKELGNVSGVEALALGTITIIGDTVRITARLVATDTAQTISAAAISVPKTEAVSKLLAQPIAGGPGCGMFVAKGAKGGGGQAANAGASTVPGVAVLPPQTDNRFSSGGLDFIVQSISRSKDNKTINVVLGVVNTDEKPAKALFLGSQAALLDNMGNQAFAQSVTGIQVCLNGPNWVNNLGGCWEHQKNEMVTLTPKVSQTVLMRFMAEDSNKKESAGITGDLVSLSSRLGIEREDEKGPAAYTISIPNIPLKQPDGDRPAGR